MMLECWNSGMLRGQTTDDRGQTAEGRGGDVPQKQEIGRPGKMSPNLTGG